MINLPYALFTKSNPHEGEVLGGKSILFTDHYRPSPSRLQTGFLHQNLLDMKPCIYRYGPKGRWVEVQVRSERMDEIAEKVCSTLQYKNGATEESGLDVWLNLLKKRSKLRV
jgi:GTP pyrophosphokinase